MATTALMSGIEFDALPYEEGRNWELLGGELIPMPSPTFEHQLLVQRLQMVLMLHFTANPNQGLSVSDVEFALGKDHRMRPDVLILLAERLASVDIEKVPVPGAPDIAVEVISPSERAVHTQAKLEAYLRLGAREVWQVYPKSKSVIIHRGNSSTTLGVGEVITTPLLPGFSLDTKKLF